MIGANSLQAVPVSVDCASPNQAAIYRAVVKLVLNVRIAGLPGGNIDIEAGSF